MATSTDIVRLRNDIGANEAALPDMEALSIYEEAGELETSAGSMNALARVIAIRRIWASSAKLASYTQNNSSEDLSDVFKHLTQLLAYWEGKLGEAQLATLPGAVQLAGLRRRPVRIREYPNG